MSRRPLLFALLAAALVAAAFVVRGSDRTPRQDSSVVESTSVDASTSADEDLALVPRARAQRAAEMHRFSDGTTSARTAQVYVTVVEHGSGRPVVDAGVWATAGHGPPVPMEDTGLTRLVLPAGPAVVGAIPPDGSSLVALERDPITGEAAAQVELHARPGEFVEVTLVLHRGATIRGQVVDDEGEPAPGAMFLHVPWHVERRSPAVEVAADDEGRFELVGLRPGEHLLGPDPNRRREAFDVERLRLAHAQTLEIDLRLLPRIRKELTVHVVQETSGDPWPFAFEVELERKNGLRDAGASVRAWSSRTNSGRSPLSFGRPVSPGEYEVRATGIIDERGSRLYVGSAFSATADVTFDSSSERQEVELTAPDVGRLARLEGTCVGAFAAEDRALRFCYSGDLWTASHPIRPRHEDGRFDIWVDLDVLPTAEVRIVERGDGFEATLATVTLLEGDQQVTVTPSPR